MPARHVSEQLRVQEADAQAPPSGGVRACSRVSNGGDTGNDRLLIDYKTPVPIENSGHWKDGVIGSPSWNFTPGLSAMVTVLPSAEIS